MPTTYQQLNSSRGSLTDNSPPTPESEYIAPPWQVSRLGQRAFASRAEYLSRVAECLKSSGARPRPVSVSARVKEWEARKALQDSARVRRAIWRGEDPDAPPTVQPRVEIRKRQEREESTTDTGPGIKRCIRTEEEEAQVVADIAACVNSQAEEAVQEEQAIFNEAPTHYEGVVVRIEESDSTPFLAFEPATMDDSNIQDIPLVRIEESYIQVHPTFGQPGDQPYIKEEETEPLMFGSTREAVGLSIKTEEADGHSTLVAPVLPIMVKAEPREEDAVGGLLIEDVSMSIASGLSFHASTSAASVIITEHRIPAVTTVLLKIEPKDEPEDLTLLPLGPHHLLSPLSSDVEMAEGVRFIDEDVVMSESILAVKVIGEPQIKEEDAIILDILSFECATSAIKPPAAAFTPAIFAGSIKSSGSAEEIAIHAVLKAEPVDDTLPLRLHEEPPIKLEAIDIDHCPLHYSRSIVKSESLNSLPGSMEDVVISFAMDDPTATICDMIIDTTYSSSQSGLVHAPSIHLDDVGLALPTPRPDAPTREVPSPLSSSDERENEHSVHSTTRNESSAVETACPSSDATEFWEGRLSYVEYENRSFVEGAEAQRYMWRSAILERDIISPSPSRSPAAELQLVARGTSIGAGTTNDREKVGCLSLRNMTLSSLAAPEPSTDNSHQYSPSDISPSLNILASSACIGVKESIFPVSTSSGAELHSQDIAPSPEFASNFAQAQLPSLLCYSTVDLSQASRCTSFYSVIEDLTDNETASSGETENEGGSELSLGSELSSPSLCALQYATPYVTAQDFFDESFDSVFGDHVEDSLYFDVEVTGVFPERGEDPVIQFAATLDANKSPRDPFEEVWQYARACYYASKAVQYGHPKGIVTPFLVPSVRESPEDYLFDTHASTERVSQPTPKPCAGGQALETDIGRALAPVNVFSRASRIHLPTNPPPAPLKPFTIPPPSGRIFFYRDFDSSSPPLASIGHACGVGPFHERVDKATAAMRWTRPRSADLASNFEPRDAALAGLGIFAEDTHTSHFSDKGRAGCSSHELLL
ncbi:hypothetical protein BC628DRAFT_857439 [Trametes gibbosa]|nr:hypothetical protein BC628DRAFT_857439 [Trametes gibbosa]